jgi:ParB-like chromosome segregation protein Spo0J
MSLLHTTDQRGTIAGTTARGDMDIDAALKAVADYLDVDDLPTKVERLNAVRRGIADLSPFAGEPVDCVEWVPAETVVANDYNPNAVAPPEMELLALSIMADGYTQPIVAMPEDGQHVVIDGFHRHRVGKESPDVAERIKGFLPLVEIREDRGDRGDRIASTIRHNRARGKHQVLAMSDIVLELKRRNWSDDKIGRELGMDPDEVLRLAQITGIAEAFKNRDFSQAWEAIIGPEDDVLEDGETDDV